MTLFAALSELAQEAGVVLDEEADVLDAVLDHGEAVEPHAEGVSGELGRVEGVVAAALVDGVEDGGVDHAAAGDFDPLGSFSLNLEFDVDLEARLSEGEEVGAEADFGFVTEHGAVEELKSAFEIREADVFVDVEALELIEDREVGGIDFVAAVG